MKFIKSDLTFDQFFDFYKILYKIIFYLNIFTKLHNTESFLDTQNKYLHKSQYMYPIAFIQNLKTFLKYYCSHKVQLLSQN